jgi:hypothetical protein
MNPFHLYSNFNELVTLKGTVKREENKVTMASRMGNDWSSRTEAKRKRVGERQTDKYSIIRRN